MPRAFVRDTGGPVEKAATEPAPRISSSRAGTQRARRRMEAIPLRGVRRALILAQHAAAGARHDAGATAPAGRTAIPPWPGAGFRGRSRAPTRALLGRGSGLAALRAVPLAG